jgi:hypothetical protein
MNFFATIEIEENHISIGLGYSFFYLCFGQVFQDGFAIILKLVVA